MKPSWASSPMSAGQTPLRVRGASTGSEVQKTQTNDSKLSVVSCGGHASLARCWTHWARLFLLWNSILLNHHRNSRLPGEEKRSMEESSKAFIGQACTIWQQIRLSITKHDEGRETQWYRRVLFEWPKSCGFLSHGPEKTASFLVKHIHTYSWLWLLWPKCRWKFI
jgi:hypothetical protein